MALYTIAVYKEYGLEESKPACLRLAALEKLEPHNLVQIGFPSSWDEWKMRLFTHKSGKNDEYVLLEEATQLLTVELEE